MLLDFPSLHRQRFHEYINAAYRNNQNQKRIMNISNQEKNLNNDIPNIFTLFHAFILHFMYFQDRFDGIIAQSATFVEAGHFDKDNIQSKAGVVAQRYQQLLVRHIPHLIMSLEFL